jgi:hypothetical protein
MKELAEFCRDLKKNFSPKIKDPRKLVSCWSEKDILNNEIVDAFVIIFRTKGCSWAHNSGCTMCGYFNDSLWQRISTNDLLKQFDTAMENYSNEKIVKIFNSGSFLDEKEIPLSVVKKILTKLFEKAEKISVESRPEYITNEKLSNIKRISKSKQFEIGIGLETANDPIREFCVNKGFTFDDYKKAAKIIKKHGFKLKTYLLIKPPFLTEKKSIEDSIKTVDKIKKITDTISFNPTNVQRNTLVEYLWKRRQYRPVWLFSITDILKESKKIAPNVLIKCDISGGGNIRGAHNCKNCDRKYLRAIEDFSLSQDLKVFQSLNCECKDRWLDLIDIEDLTFGSVIDI